MKSAAQVSPGSPVQSDPPATRVTRQAHVVELLRTLDDARAGFASGDGPSDAEPDRLLLMPPDYHAGSYKELERCLPLLRVADPVLWWHVSERWLRCDRRRRLVGRVAGRWQVRRNEAVVTVGQGSTRKRRPGRPANSSVDVVVERWHPEVRMAQANEGVRWLAQRMRHVRLPPGMVPGASFDEVPLG